MGRSNPSKAQRAARREARNTTASQQDQTERIFAFGELVLRQTLAAVGAARPRSTDQAGVDTISTQTHPAPLRASTHEQTNTRPEPRPSGEADIRLPISQGRAESLHHQSQSLRHPTASDARRERSHHPRSLAERITFPTHLQETRVAPPRHQVPRSRPLAERISLPSVPPSRRIASRETQQPAGATRRRRRGEEDRENLRYQPYRR